MPGAPRSDVAPGTCPGWLGAQGPCPEAFTIVETNDFLWKIHFDFFVVMIYISPINEMNWKLRLCFHVVMACFYVIIPYAFFLKPLILP